MGADIIQTPGRPVHEIVELRRSRGDLTAVPGDEARPIEADRHEMAVSQYVMSETEPAGSVHDVAVYIG
jgi:hypothetical protein